MLLHPHCDTGDQCPITERHDDGVRRACFQKLNADGSRAFGNCWVMSVFDEDTFGVLIDVLSGVLFGVVKV